MDKEVKEYPNINGIYKHYKGGKYEVITLAKHTETEEDMVVYQSLTFGTVFVRPLSIWDSPVEESGAIRFQYISTCRELL